jgi:hypothetical protein
MSYPITCDVCNGSTEYDICSDKHVCQQCGETINERGFFAVITYYTDGRIENIPTTPSLRESLKKTEEIFDRDGVKGVILIDRLIPGSVFCEYHTGGKSPNACFECESRTGIAYDPINRQPCSSCKNASPSLNVCSECVEKTGAPYSSSRADCRKCEYNPDNDMRHDRF